MFAVARGTKFAEVEEGTQLHSSEQIGKLLYSLRSLQDSEEARSLLTVLTPKVEPDSSVLRYSVFLLNEQ